MGLADGLGLCGIRAHQSDTVYDQAPRKVAAVTAFGFAYVAVALGVSWGCAILLTRRLALLS